MADNYDGERQLIPATIGQRLLSLMAHYRGGNGAMNCPIIYRLRGRLHEMALSAALEELTRRHESLRTTVSRQAGRLMQHIHPPRTVPVRRVDLRGAGQHAVSVELALVTELRTEIPPGSWPLRVTLFRTGADDYLLCLVLHHYVTDGWSNTIVRDELWQLYDQIAAGYPMSLPSAGWQYRDFARWQADREGGPAWREHEGYWRRRLYGVAVPSLPRADVSAPAASAAVETFLVPDSSVSAMEKLAGQERTTLFTAMLSVFYLWLHQTTGKTDLAVGSMFANRLRPEAIRGVGFYANLLVLRTAIPASGTFRDLLKATRVTVNGALDHQEVPYQMVRTGPSAYGSVRPEDLMFQMQPWPVDEHRSLVNAQVWQEPPPEGVITRFAFELFMWPASAGGLLGQIVFAQERFERSWVREAATGYAALAARVATTPDAPLRGALPCLGTWRQRKMIKCGPASGPRSPTWLPRRGPRSGPTHG